MAGGFGHSFPSDVWSFGVILYRMKFGVCPFESESLQETVRRIKTAEYTFSKWVTVSPELKDLIQRILQIDYDSRPTIDEIEAHPFFDSGQSDNTLMKKSSSLKGFIQRLFSKEKRQVENSLQKVDSCKNLKEMKTILRDKTQEKEYSTKDSTIKDDRQRLGSSNAKLSTANTMRGVVTPRYDEATTSYYANANLPEQKPSKVLSKPRSTHPSVTQYFPHCLIYSVDIYDECTILYLTNGLRQILKDREIYLVFSGRQVVDKHGAQIEELPRLVDYICREKIKESQYKASEHAFKEQVSRRNFVAKWKTVDK